MKKIVPTLLTLFFVACGTNSAIDEKVETADTDVPKTKMMTETKVKADELIEVKKPEIEVVFVLDTTGSMSSLIAAAKEKIWAIANTLATAKPTPNIKMGLVGYRDIGDAYVTKFTTLTDDLDAVYADLMDFRADGGGDGPESVNQALHEAVTKIKWSSNKDTYKVIFLVGDAPPHMDYKQDVKYAVSAKKAIENGIVINTIQCGSMGGTEPVWREIAKLAEGQYFRVSQSGDAVHYKTPFDDEIARLSLELDKTRVYYGSSKDMKKNAERSKISYRINSSAKSSAVAQRISFNTSAAGKRNFLGHNELVDAVAKKEVKLEDIEEKHLPENMKKMTLEERTKYLKDMAEKREKITKQIVELSKKRQEDILEQVKKQGEKAKSSLDMQIYESIKEQAEDKDIEYKGGPKY